MANKGLVNRQRQSVQTQYDPEASALICGDLIWLRRESDCTKWNTRNASTQPSRCGWQTASGAPEAEIAISLSTRIGIIQAMTSGMRSRALSLGLAALLAAAGYVALLGYNGAGIVFFFGAALAVVFAFRDHALSTFALLVAGVCAFASWATLNGGADSATAIPWVVAGTASAVLAIWLMWRRVQSVRSHPGQPN